MLKCPIYVSQAYPPSRGLHIRGRGGRRSHRRRDRRQSEERHHHARRIGACPPGDRGGASPDGVVRPQVATSPPGESRRRLARPDRPTPAGPESQGPQHQRGFRNHQAPGRHAGPKQNLRSGQIPRLHPRADGHSLRGLQAAGQECAPDPARHRRGGQPTDRRSRGGKAEILRRAQERFRARRAGLPATDRHFDRRKNTRSSGRGRKEGQGPGDPRAQGREVRGPGGHQFRSEQVFLQQIVISTEGKTPDQVAAAEKKAKDLVTRARKGEKFADLAATNSDDLETARNGGELPAYKRDQLTKELADIVFKQKKGYVTDPIRGPSGLVIFRIMERYDKGLATYEEVENEIGERMVMPQMNAKVRIYLTKLRQEAFLEIKPGYVDSGAAPGKDTSWKDVAQLKPQTVTKEEVAAHRRRKRLLFAIPIPGTGDKKKPSSKPSEPAAPTQATAAPPSASAPPAAAPIKP